MHFTKQQRDDWANSTRSSPFNRWLHDQVSRPDGTLDLDRLYALATTYGIDANARYGHLNPGQQRMNVGNRLRPLVPQQVYSHYGGARPVIERVSAPNAQAESFELEAHRPLIDVPVASLMARYGEILDELMDRAVIRTRNSPVGDYAEYLFTKCFEWELAANSTSGHDATDSAGTRYQVKCRRVGSGDRGTRQLSIFRGLPDSKFDVLAGVLFNQRFRVERAALIPHNVVLSRSAYIQHVNGWRFNLDDAVWLLPNVRDVTEELRMTEQSL